MFNYLFCDRENCVVFENINDFTVINICSTGTANTLSVKLNLEQ